MRDMDYKDLKLDSFMMLHLQSSNWKMTLVMYQSVPKC